jgi:hypothetical protein
MYCELYVVTTGAGTAVTTAGATIGDESVKGNLDGAATETTAREHATSANNDCEINEYLHNIIVINTKFID